MEPIRSVVVFDAADLGAESAFWAGMLDGHVFADEAFHCVIDGAGEWRIGVQLAPNHIPPDWPDGAPQQVHIDLHVEEPRPAHEQAMNLGARLLQAGGLESGEGTMCTPTRPVTRSASAGDIRPETHWRRSSASGWDRRPVVAFMLGTAR